MYTGYHQACSHSNHSTIHGFTHVYRVPSGMFSFKPLNHPWFYPCIQGSIRHVLTPTTQPSMVLPKYTEYYQACSHSNHSTIHGFTPVYRVPSGMFSLQPLNRPWFYPSIQDVIRHVLTPTTQLSMVLPKYTGCHQACSHSNHSTVNGFTLVYKIPSGMFSLQPLNRPWFYPSIQDVIRHVLIPTTQPSMVLPMYTGYYQACSHPNHSTIHGFTQVYRMSSGMFSLRPLDHPWFYPSIQSTIRHVLTPTTQPSMVLPQYTEYHQACSHSNHSTIHGFTQVYRMSSGMFSLQPLNRPWFYPSIQDTIRHVLTPTTQPSMVLPKYTGCHQECSHSNHSTIHGFTHVYRVPSGMFSSQPLNHPWFYPSIQDTIRHVLTPTTHPSMVLPKYTGCNQACSHSNHSTIHGFAQVNRVP
jgi:hypothetical protein